MHKQRPQTVYRNMPFLIGTIFENCDKWYRTWRVEHPEFTRIVFHGLRHSSATYQLMISGGDVKTVQRPCSLRTKRKSHEESCDFSWDFGALEGTRIPGPLIKRAPRAEHSDFETFEFALFFVQSIVIFCPAISAPFVVFCKSECPLHPLKPCKNRALTLGQMKNDDF